MKRREREGAALVVVLVLLVALGAMATVMGRAVRLEANNTAALRARTVARYAAESGVVLAQWRLQALLDSAQLWYDMASPFKEAEAWLARVDRVSLGDARFEVEIIDLNSRVDLNRSSAATVRRLLEQFTSHTRAADIAAAIKARPLHRVGELMLLPGVDEILATALAPYVTVWGDGTVNVNSAPEPVLAALPQIGVSGARNIIRRRGGGEILGSAESIRPGSPSMAQPVPPDEDDVAPDDLDFMVSTAPTRFLVVSRGWRTGHPLTHEIQVVYAVMGAHLTLHMWQERDL